LVLGSWFFEFGISSWRQDMNYSKQFMVEARTNVKLHEIDPGYIDSDMTEEVAALAEGVT
jgi:hypothetical protein